MRTILMTCLLSSVCGCFPAITHGARVEDGFVAGLTGGLTSGDTHVEGDEGGFHLRQPVIGPFVGYGAASTNRALPRFYVAAGVPLFFPLTQIDAYLQAPPAWTRSMSVGVGATGSLEGGTLYGMVGGQFNEATGWTLGAGYGSRTSSSQFQSSSPAWVGSAAVEKAVGYLRTQVFLQYANGRIPGSCFNSPGNGSRTCTLGEPAHAISIGISLGRHEHTAGRRTVP